MVSVPAAASHAAHRRGLTIVEADGGANIRFCRTGAIGRIETDPAEVLDQGLGPGMARGMSLMAPALGQDSRLHSAPARRDVRQTAQKIWAWSWQTPPPCSKRLGAGGMHMGLALAVFDRRRRWPS